MVVGAQRHSAWARACHLRCVDRRGPRHSQSEECAGRGASLAPTFGGRVGRGAGKAVPACVVTAGLGAAGLGGIGSGVCMGRKLWEWVR